VRTVQRVSEDQVLDSRRTPCDRVTLDGSTLRPRFPQGHNLRFKSFDASTVTIPYHRLMVLQVFVDDSKRPANKWFNDKVAEGKVFYWMEGSLPYFVIICDAGDTEENKWSARRRLAVILGRICRKPETEKISVWQYGGAEVAEKSFLLCGPQEEMYVRPKIDIVEEKLAQLRAMQIELENCDEPRAPQLAGKIGAIVSSYASAETTSTEITMRQLPSFPVPPPPEPQDTAEMPETCTYTGDYSVLNPIPSSGFPTLDTQGYSQEEEKDPKEYEAREAERTAMSVSQGFSQENDEGSPSFQGLLKRPNDTKGAEPPSKKPKIDGQETPDVNFEDWYGGEWSPPLDDSEIDMWQ